MRGVILGSYVGLAMFMTIGFIAVFVKMASIAETIEKRLQPPQRNAPEAQQDEQWSSNPQEASSNLAGGTKFERSGHLEPR